MRKGELDTFNDVVNDYQEKQGAENLTLADTTLYWNGGGDTVSY